MSRKRLLNTIFTVVSTSALIIAIVVALIYSQGNTITPTGLVGTGTIKINLSPRGDFMAYINGERKTVSSSDTIDNINEGEYLLRITQPEYSDWEQTVSVRAGLVSEVSVQLFPKELKFEQLSSTNINQVFFSPTKRFAYYTVTNSAIGSNQGIWRQTIVDSNIPLVSEAATKISNLTNSIKNAAENDKLTLLPSPDDNLLLVNNATANRFFLLETNRYNEPNTSTELKFDYPIASIDWLNNNSLLVQTQNLLLDYNISRNTSTLIALESDASDTTVPYSKSASSVVFIKNGNLFQYFEGRSKEIVLENISLPANTSTVYASENNDTDFIIRADQTLYFLDSTNSLLTSLGELEVVSIAPSNRRIIARNPDSDELLSITVLVSLARNVIEVQKRPIDLTSLENSSIVWANNSNYIIFQHSTDEENSLPTLSGADAFGRNSIELITLSNEALEALNTSFSFAIPADNSGLIVTLPDNFVTSNTGSARNNLYRIAFSVTN